MLPADHPILAQLIIIVKKKPTEVGCSLDNAMNVCGIDANVLTLAIVTDQDMIAMNGDDFSVVMREASTRNLVADAESFHGSSPAKLQHR